jgi:hypothetical protein
MRVTVGSLRRWGLLIAIPCLGRRAVALRPARISINGKWRGASNPTGSSLAGVSTAEVEALRILHDGIRQLLGILPFFLDALQRERWWSERQMLITARRREALDDAIRLASWLDGWSAVWARSSWDKPGDMGISRNLYSFGVSWKFPSFVGQVGQGWAWRTARAREQGDAVDKWIQ